MFIILYIRIEVQKNWIKTLIECNIVGLKYALSYIVNTNAYLLNNFKNVFKYVYWVRYCDNNAPQCYIPTLF